MGSASRVTPGRPHNDSLAASLPIENSPPGIHTMPFGAGVGAGVLFGTVGSNGDGVAAESLPMAASGATTPTEASRNFTTTTVPTITAPARSSHQSLLDRE